MTTSHPDRYTTRFTCNHCTERTITLQTGDRAMAWKGAYAQGWRLIQRGPRWLHFCSWIHLRSWERAEHRPLNVAYVKGYER